MRQNTELTVMPPEFTVTVENDRAIITFYTDVQEVRREGQEETQTAYAATAWTMNAPAAHNLSERIAAQPGLWLARVKAVTEAEEAADELERLKETATDDAVCELAGIVADLTDAVTELASMIAGM